MKLLGLSRTEEMLHRSDRSFFSFWRMQKRNTPIYLTGWLAWLMDIQSDFPTRVLFITLLRNMVQVVYEMFINSFTIGTTDVNK